MYSIKQTSDSFNTFYQVFLNGVIVAQRDSLEDAQEYVASKVQCEMSLNFSKVTVNAAAKASVELCTSVVDELHIIADFENNDCAACAYELFEGVLFLKHNWSGLELPHIITNEKELREVIKLVK